MTQTTYLVTVIHDKPLPPLYREKVEAYCYDFLTARNVKVDVELQDWHVVEEAPLAIQWLECQIEGVGMVRKRVGAA